MLSLLRYEVRSRLGAILGWGVGLALFATLYVGFYPEIGSSFSSLEDLSIYRAMGVELGGVEGYITSTAVQFTPIILGIFAIIAGTGTLAGQEDRGTLELVLASPLKRWQIVSMKALALGIVMLLILGIAALGNLLVVKAVDIEMQNSAWALPAAILNAWPVTMAFAMISLFLGTFLPTRRTAALVAAVVFLSNYFGQMAVNMVDSLDPVRPFLLFTYFDSSQTVLLDGVHARDVLVLIGVALVFLVLAVVSFQRRNVTVAAWPWDRAAA